MYKVNYDVTNNRIYSGLEGCLTTAEAKKCMTELKTHINKARPGFTAIFDVADVNVLSQDVTEIIAKGKRYAAAKGLEKSALVINSSILKMEGNRSLKDISMSRHGYFDSIVKAEEFVSK
jgi:hypothetical protein